MRPRQTKVWLCEGRALQGKNGPHSRTTQLSLCQIQPGTQSQQGGVTWIWEEGSSGSLVRLGEGGRNAPHPRATQLSLLQILPRHWQGGATRIQESGTNRSPVRGRSQSGFRESGKNGPHTKATQLTESARTSTPQLRQLTPQLGSSG